MLLRHLSFLALLVLTAPAQAADVGDPDDLWSVQVHAFVSQGFVLSAHNNYLAKSKDGSLEFAEAGVNFTKPLTDRLRLGIQLFARDLGPVGNYDAKLDWFYLDYRFNDWLGIRAGRTKIPFGLYNEVQDVDAARVPILLPQSIYPTLARDYLLAVTGGELYGRARLGSGGALDYRLYGGSIFLDANTAPGSPYEILELNIPYVAGARVLWETPVEALRLGGSVQALKYDAKLLENRMRVVELDVDAVLWVASIEYAPQDWLLVAEYSRWHVHATSTLETLREVKTVSERGYGMISYRMASWFQPGLYYSLLFPDTELRSGRSTYQHDVAVTARYDINPYWLIKLEGHYMYGTAGLDSALNDNVPQSRLAPHTGVFLAKTTAYF